MLALPVELAYTILFASSFWASADVRTTFIGFSFIPIRGRVGLASGLPIVR